MSSKEQQTTFILLPEAEFKGLLEMKDKVDRILELLQDGSKGKEGVGNFISEKDAQRLLGKKYSSLYNLRVNGKLAFTKIGNKTFYSTKDITGLLEANTRRPFNK